MFCEKIKNEIKVRKMLEGGRSHSASSVGLEVSQVLIVLEQDNTNALQCGPMIVLKATKGDSESGEE